MLFGLDKISGVLNKWFTWMGGIALLTLTGIACANMLLRSMGSPLTGAYELVGFFGALVVALTLGYGQITRSHISVDILANRYSKRIKRMIHAINSFVCMIFFVLVAWQSAVYATTIWKRGETSETLRIIYYPFVYVVAICCLLLAFVLMIDFLKSFLSEKGEK
ncbi:MAG: TRAP transporter small permease [Thermodesulfobacteriota bacterium]|nr:TRAP transporter small permease [Thermodesulfobacteriota bacterium]